LTPTTGHSARFSLSGERVNYPSIGFEQCPCLNHQKR
jgi:hypothetical protein